MQTFSVVSNTCITPMGGDGSPRLWQEAVASWQTVAPPVESKLNCGNRYSGALCRMKLNSRCWRQTDIRTSSSVKAPFTLCGAQLNERYVLFKLQGLATLQGRIQDLARWADYGEHKPIRGCGVEPQ